MINDKLTKINTTAAKADLSQIWRFYVMVSFICLSLIVIIARLYFIQIKEYGAYRQMADGQHMLKETILPKRGQIFLKEKNDLFPAAVNREMAMVYAVPKEIEERDLAIKTLTNILHLDENEVKDRINKEEDLYEVIKRKISPEEENQLKEKKIKGVYITQENWRYYPGGSLAAQTIGFIGYNNDIIEGRYGIERIFEDQLKGNSGELQQERDTGGRWISIGSKSITPAMDGKNLVLSLDHIIQFKAEQVLRNAIEQHKSDGGRIIIMEPYSGQIIAMANEPTFNANDYSKVEDINTFRNSIVSDAYECGSVFKPFTMAMGLDTGKVTPDTTFVDTGSVVEANYNIKNSDEKAHGVQTMTNVIEKSLNTGVIFVEKQVGNERFLHYVQDFGFGEKTGIQLPNEGVGNISNLKTNRNIEYFTASFGQGITVTPLQLAVAYSSIANGGDLVKAQIIDTIDDGYQKQKIDREVIRRVISKNTANQLALMLESNVIKGHGKLAGVPGYRVAGKTGTAQVPDYEKGGYKDGVNTGSFAGFAPVDNPQFVMVVVIENPKEVLWAESTAAPVFGEMSKFLFDYYGIEPTEDFTMEDMEKFEKSHGAIDETEKPEDNSQGTKINPLEEKKSQEIDKEIDKKKKN